MYIVNVIIIIRWLHAAQCTWMKLFDIYNGLIIHVNKIRIKYMNKKIKQQLILLKKCCPSW